jgi:glucokinase
MRFGMDFGGTNLKAGLFDDDGATVRFEEFPLAAVTGQGSLLDALIRVAGDIASGQTIDGGGLAIKGLVDVDRGMILEDIGAGALVAGIDLRIPFSRALHAPFVIENDARSYALGEATFGAGRDADGIACLTLGTGVGCAIIMNGVPYRGADSLGGLLGGHISIDRNGPVCACGSRGCLELYCSATALHGRVRSAHPVLAEGNGDPLVGFFDAVRSGANDVRSTFDEILDDLSLGVVNVIHAYAPSVIILGGGVMQSSDVILPPLRDRVNRMAWTVPRGKVQIRAGMLANKAAALGAAFHPALSTH